MEEVMRDECFRTDDHAMLTLIACRWLGVSQRACQDYRNSRERKRERERGRERKREREEGKRERGKEKEGK